VKGGECTGVFWTDHNNFDVAGDELGTVLAQLCHVRSAEWSGEATIRDQQDVHSAGEIRQADNVAGKSGWLKSGAVWLLDMRGIFYSVLRSSAAPLAGSGSTGEKSCASLHDLGFDQSPVHYHRSWNFAQSVYRR
jgi:hypothetical protein